MREHSRAIFSFFLPSFFFFFLPWEDKKVNSFTVYSLEKLQIIAGLWNALPEQESKLACLQSLKE